MIINSYKNCSHRTVESSCCVSEGSRNDEGIARGMNRSNYDRSDNKFKARWEEFQKSVKEHKIFRFL